MPDHAMPDPLTRPDQAAVPADAALTATAQLMLFRPGIYAVTLHATQSMPTDIGLTLPSVRLDPLPPATQSEGRAYVSGTAEGGWIARSTDQMFIVVADGPARMILTTYKTGATGQAPELRITNVTKDGLAPAASQLASLPAVPPPLRLPERQVATVGEPARPSASAERRVGVVAHAITGARHEAAGDAWAGVPGTSLEGFVITMPPGLGEADGDMFEYQAIMGSDWDTPWFRAGLFCGSRGLSLALLGYRVRLSPVLAASHRCTYWGRFKGGGVAGPFADGAACSLDERELEAIRLLIEPRETACADPERPATRPARVSPARARKGVGTRPA